MYNIQHFTVLNAVAGPYTIPSGNEYIKVTNLGGNVIELHGEPIQPGEEREMVTEGNRQFPDITLNIVNSGNLRLEVRNTLNSGNSPQGGVPTIPTSGL